MARASARARPWRHTEEERARLWLCRGVAERGGTSRTTLFDPRLRAIAIERRERVVIEKLVPNELSRFQRARIELRHQRVVAGLDGSDVIDAEAHNNDG